MKGGGATTACHQGADCGEGTATDDTADCYRKLCLKCEFSSVQL